MASLVYLLYEAEDSDTVDAGILPLLKDQPVATLVIEPDSLPDVPENSRVMTWLSDKALKRLMANPACHSWQWGLLPHPDMSHAKLGYGIAGKLEDAIEDIVSQDEASTIDLMYCNDELVFNSVMVGDTYSLKPARAPDESLWIRFHRFVRLLRNVDGLTLRSFKITTKKEKLIDTAALGVVVVEHGKNSSLTRRVLGGTSLSDGKLNALILAPRSVFEFLRFLFFSVFLPSRNIDQLPEFIGHVKAESLTLTSGKEAAYTLDGVVKTADKLDIGIRPRSAHCFIGRHLAIDDDGKSASDKESVRMQNLPIGEAKAELISYPMPWIHHASSEEFRDLFQALRENAKSSESYLTLMVLSSLLATIGLFAGSAPVIIGAMILAPLMSPIIAMAMALLRQEERMIRECARTMAIGIGLSILCAVLLAWLTPLQTLNAEIAARTKPTLLDMGVAVISGIAGAYASARSQVAKSLAGVAIAVALIPPLAVTGIGIGWFDWRVFSGAALLFVTNLAGIILAAALTFLVLGYSPFKRARQGIVLSLVMVALVSIPLALGFRQMVVEHNMVRLLNGWDVEQVRLHDVDVDLGNPVLVRTRLVSPSPLQDQQLDAIKQAIEQRLEREILLQAVVALER